MQKMTRHKEKLGHKDKLVSDLNSGSDSLKM
jgi:hypothetical protein